MTPAPWSDLRLRIASAAIMTPLGLAAIWAGGAVWLVVLAFLGGIVAYEWIRLSHGATSAATGVGYVLLACVSLALLRLAPTGFGDVLFLMLVVWAGDIGAYLTGRQLGGPRLAPAISPGKTWSGAAGGLAFSILAGLAVAAGFGNPRPFHAGLIGAALALVAQAGDLLESGLKRWSGAKDSGGLIPGHGGLLDRVDGLLAAAPAGLVIRLLAGQGGYLWA